MGIDRQGCDFGWSNVGTTRSGLRKRFHFGWLKVDGFKRGD